MRSPFLLDRRTSGLLIVDVQQKLLPLIENHQRLAWNIGRLIQGASILGVPIAGTEQYPQGIGPTVPKLRELLPRPIAHKLMFSCRECTALTRDFRDQDKEQIVVAGIETHVCIQQTALDFLAQGFQVFIVIDGVSSRHELDHNVALRRMESAGATLTTVESVLFEWCETSACPEFKEISRLVRNQTN
ncbi:MAG TPA: hydrolase [Pirellulaceae bacterium]|nr:hydrolase [Pirellulaceae bacterium]